MAESNPSYLNPCVLPEGKGTPSLLAATSSLRPPHAAHSVNMAYRNGVGIRISNGAVSFGSMAIRGYPPTVTGLQEFQPIGPLPHTIEEPKVPEVPIDAERILAWTTKADRLEFVLDTFEVNFQRRVLRDGELAARQWYRWQVIRTFGESLPQLSPRIAGLIYLLRKIGLF
jgi:hypothetical protein